jgi:hypothetical protein
MTTHIEKLAKAFKKPSELIKFGCDRSSVDQRIETCRKINENKTYCVVKSWCLWKLKEDAGDNLEKSTLTVIKADSIIEDELDRFPAFGWVRSTPIIGLYEECIFETANTFYIAVGGAVVSLLILVMLWHSFNYDGR